MYIHTKPPPPPPPLRPSPTSAPLLAAPVADCCTTNTINVFITSELEQHAPERARLAAAAAAVDDAPGRTAAALSLERRLRDVAAAQVTQIAAARAELARLKRRSQPFWEDGADADVAPARSRAGNAAGANTAGSKAAAAHAIRGCGAVGPDHRRGRKAPDGGRHKGSSTSAAAPNTTAGVAAAAVRGLGAFAPHGGRKCAAAGTRAGAGRIVPEAGPDAR